MAIAETQQAAGGADALLVEYVARGGSRCPSCGYSLDGLRSDRCPECGEALRLVLRAVDPRMGCWVAGLIGLAGGMGFFIVFLGFFLFAVVVGDADLSDMLEVWPMWLGLAVQGGALGVWVAQGRRVRRRPRGVRLTLAIGAWVLSGVVTASMIWALIEHVF